MPVKIVITSEAPIAALDAAAEAIQRGGLVIFPTDTLYGMGCDAFNADAVAELAFARRRPPDKPFPVIVASVEEVGRVAREITDTARRLMERFFPGALTLVLPRHPDLPAVTTGGADTVGVRVPNDRVAHVLLRRSGRALTAPSANLSNEPPAASFAGLSPAIIAAADYVIDAGPRPGPASTVIDLTVAPPRLIREGAVKRQEVESILGDLT